MLTSAALAAGFTPAATLSPLSPSDASSGCLEKSQPYTGMGAGPSRSDRPMRENHRGFPSSVLGGAPHGFRSAMIAIGLRELLEAAQAVVDRRLGQLHPARQLAQVQVRVLGSPAPPLAP